MNNSKGKTNSPGKQLSLDLEAKIQEVSADLRINNSTTVINMRTYTNKSFVGYITKNSKSF
ncbi:hypothetical protein SAMN05444682_1172 [Parapedobacter indicus]|uniref:Uncharacterized protein n=1 Tax=Parapedobacter indicus TaxID=1477437 RepID=A0A1I3VGN9_9SPHI|nr:hypothetical protein CLV26_11746 [Parapedobacter indicus]SFJ94445.1 hypothetical protein SAMN05444682_1172 [Parapedobacter indicus]